MKKVTKHPALEYREAYARAVEILRDNKRVQYYVKRIQDGVNMPALKRKRGL